jgi:hypothetical protein
MLGTSYSRSGWFSFFSGAENSFPVVPRGEGMYSGTVLEKTQFSLSLRVDFLFKNYILLQYIIECKFY